MKKAPEGFKEGSFYIRTNKKQLQIWACKRKYFVDREVIKKLKKKPAGVKYGKDHSNCKPEGRRGQDHHSS
ncbi:hypothetical protein [Pelotomaculum propionicicum]|uniref:hypothetical protein n=1 Tax=Pelotomaculum propionicicum TaxID=258475 RepID=UPI003BA3D7BA